MKWEDSIGVCERGAARVRGFKDVSEVHGQVHMETLATTTLLKQLQGKDASTAQTRSKSKLTKS